MRSDVYRNATRTGLGRFQRLQDAVLDNLLKALLQCAIGLLSGREIARLQGLAQLRKLLTNRTGYASAATMMMVSLCLCRLSLKVLLNRRVVLLSSRYVPRLEILRELVECLRDGVAAL